MTRKLLTCISFFLLHHVVIGQERSQMSFVNDQIEGLNGEMTRVTGYIENAMPFEMLFSKGDNEACTGLIRYGSSDLINLEGECSDSTISLYEFDEHARVSGVITGSHLNGSYNLKWSNFDHSLSYFLLGRENYLPTNKIGIYSVKEESDFDHLIIWHDEEKINLQAKQSSILRWLPYNCPHAAYACQFDNDVGEKKNIAISDRDISVAGRLFQFTESLDVMNESAHQYNYFYNFRYPLLGQGKYDKFIQNIIREEVELFMKGIQLEPDSDLDLEDRLSNRAIGDFYISLVSPDVFSGFYTFYSSIQPRVKTIAFTYNRQKNKFYNLSDIWEKDFDYTFFLKQIIENKKRALLKKEEALVRKMLKKDNFSHFMLSPHGLVFFTDQNFVYGRRSVLLPFDEIGPFVGDKSISNLINQ